MKLSLKRKGNNWTRNKPLVAESDCSTQSSDAPHLHFIESPPAANFLNSSQEIEPVSAMFGSQSTVMSESVNNIASMEIDKGEQAKSEVITQVAVSQTDENTHIHIDASTDQPYEQSNNAKSRDESVSRSNLKHREKVSDSVVQLDVTRIKLALAIGFVKRGRKYNMSGAAYYDKWRLSTIQYSPSYIIEQKLEQSYSRTSSDINQLIDTTINKTRHTLTQIVESAKIDVGNNLTPFPTEDAMFLIAVCVDYLKDPLWVKSLKVEMITKCLSVAFVDATVAKSPGYDEFVVQGNKVLANVWKSVLNFAQSWQVPLMTTFARWRRVVFLGYACDYLNSWLGSVHQPHTLDATEASALDNMMTILRQVKSELTYSDVKFMRTALHSLLVDVDVRSAMGHIIDQVESILADELVENGPEKLRQDWCNNNKDV